MARNDDSRSSDPSLAGAPGDAARRLVHAECAVAEFLSVFGRGPLVTVSFATTAYGAYQLYASAVPGDGALGLLAYAIPLVSAAYLHKLIIDWFNRFSEGRRHSLLIGAVSLQLIAIVLSFGAHWTHFLGGAETIASFEATQQQIIREIGAERARFRVVVEQAKEIAEYSQERATTELNYGRTCDPVRAGDGPRRRLRQEDQQVFADVRAQAGKRLAELNAILNAAAMLAPRDAREAGRDSSELKRVVNRVREFETDPFLGSLKRTAEERLTRGLGPIPIVAGNGRAGAATFSCPDLVLAKHLKDLLAAIAGVRPVGEVVFTDYTNPRAGARAATSRLLWSLFSWFSTESPREERVRLMNSANFVQDQAHGLQPDDWLALAWACFVEWLLFLSYTVGVRRPLLPKAEGLEDIGEALDKNSQGRLNELWRAVHAESEVLEIIDRHIFWHWWGGARIFVPMDGANREAVRLRRFLELAASSRVIRRGVTGWVLPWIMAIGWNAECRKRIFAASQVRTYVLSDADVVIFLLQLREADAASGPNQPNGAAANASGMSVRDPRRAGLAVVRKGL